MRVTVDTSILVYTFSSKDAKHAAANALLRRVANGDCVQPMQTFGEFLHVVTRRYRSPVEDAVSAIGRFRAIMASTTADEEDFDEAARIVARYRAQFWDALIWATARRAGSRALLTEDLPGFPDLGGLTFVNPFDPANERLLGIILPPAEH